MWVEKKNHREMCWSELKTEFFGIKWKLNYSNCHLNIKSSVTSYDWNKKIIFYGRVFGKKKKIDKSHPEFSVAKKRKSSVKSWNRSNIFFCLGFFSFLISHFTQTLAKGGLIHLKIIELHRRERKRKEMSWKSSQANLSAEV